MKHKKIKAAILVGAIALGTFGGASAANAATAYDTFAVYVSSPAGATLSGDSDHNGIVWEYGHVNDIQNNLNTVYVGLVDNKPDGNGPIARVREYGANGVFEASHDFHNTMGNGTTLNANYAFSGFSGNNPKTDSDGITIQICNGYTSAGYAENCGTVHGPFHAY